MRKSKMLRNGVASTISSPVSVQCLNNGAAAWVLIRNPKMWQPLVYGEMRLHIIHETLFCCSY